MRFTIIILALTAKQNQGICHMTIEISLLLLGIDMGHPMKQVMMKTVILEELVDAKVEWFT